MKLLCKVPPMLETRQGDVTDGQLESLYQVMKGRAKQCLLSEFPGHRLQTTALVHEAYIRLRESSAEWHSTQHFLNTISTTMRRVLVDEARARGAGKRGGALKKQMLRDYISRSDLSVEKIVAVHDALEHYSIHQPVKAKLVELRVFAGLSLEAAADALGLSSATAKRYWAIAKLQLAKILED